MIFLIGFILILGACQNTNSKATESQSVSEQILDLNHHDDIQSEEKGRWRWSLIN